MVLPMNRHPQGRYITVRAFRLLQATHSQIAFVPELGDIFPVLLVDSCLTNVPQETSKVLFAYPNFIGFPRGHGGLSSRQQRNPQLQKAVFPDPAKDRWERVGS